MVEITRTVSALNDLNNIAEYIALSNLQAVKKLKKIFDKVTRLESHSESGKVPLELKSLNYREIVVNPCLIFYKIENNHVYILHLMRQERNIRKFILQS